MYSAFGIKKKIASNKAVNSFALLTGTRCMLSAAYLGVQKTIGARDYSNNV
jgi:hypothetical protein